MRIVVNFKNKILLLNSVNLMLSNEHDIELKLARKIITVYVKNVLEQWRLFEQFKV
jgi:hypothetical protein